MNFSKITRSVKPLITKSGLENKISEIDKCNLRLFSDTTRELGTLFMGNHRVKSEEVKNSLLKVLSELKQNRENLFKEIEQLQGEPLEKIEILEVLQDVSGYVNFYSKFKSPFINVADLDDEAFKCFFNVSEYLYDLGYKFALSDFKIYDFLINATLDNDEYAQFSFICVPGYFTVIAGAEDEKLKFFKSELSFFKNEDLPLVLNSFFGDK